VAADLSTHIGVNAVAEICEADLSAELESVFTADLASRYRG
jgi:hypothetical protein